MNIAVIVPVYNVEPYLHRCVDSILSQTHHDFSLILVDDGSTDGSGAICDGYAAKDARVRVIHQANCGVSAARNAALDAIEQEQGSEWVTFVDSDDWVASEYLEELVRGLSGGAEIAVARCVRTSAEYVEWNRSSSIEWRVMTPREFWSKTDYDLSAAWGKLYARRLFADVRYPIGKINEDEYTTYRVFFKASRVACTARSLYAYYVRPDSIMNIAWSPKRLDRLQAWRDQIRCFSDLGYSELVARSRQHLCDDLVDDIRNLRERGDGHSAERLRQELAALLKEIRGSIKENYLAYKTAWPMRTHLLKLIGRV